MQNMIALKDIEYAGQRIAAGARFEIREEFVNLYTQLGRAKLAPAKPRAGLYKTRDIAQAPQNRMELP